MGHFFRGVSVLVLWNVRSVVLISHVRAGAGWVWCRAVPGLGQGRSRMSFLAPDRCIWSGILPRMFSTAIY